MQITKTVPVSQRKQLIDLNGDTVNFNITFTATSKNSEPFEIIVVDQDTLDKKPNLEFKKVNGSISGNIISDKNLYQNYYICLKATNPCDVEVVIDKKEIDPVKPRPDIQPKKLLPHVTKHPIPIPYKPSINWKSIFIVILVIVGGVILYYMYFNKNDSKNFKIPSMYNEKTFNSTTTSELNTKTTPKAPGPTQNDTYTNFGLGSKKTNDSLISRLNSLPLK